MKVTGLSLGSGRDCRWGEWITSTLFHLQYHDWGETLEQGSPGSATIWLPTALGVWSTYLATSHFTFTSQCHWHCCGLDHQNSVSISLRPMFILSILNSMWDYNKCVPKHSMLKRVCQKSPEGSIISGRFLKCWSVHTIMSKIAHNPLRFGEGFDPDL